MVYVAVEIYAEVCVKAFQLFIGGPGGFLYRLGHLFNNVVIHLVICIACQAFKSVNGFRGLGLDHIPQGVRRIADILGCTLAGIFIGPHLSSATIILLADAFLVPGFPGSLLKFLQGFFLSLGGLVLGFLYVLGPDLLGSGLLDGRAQLVVLGFLFLQCGVLLQECYVVFPAHGVDLLKGFLVCTGTLLRLFKYGKKGVEVVNLLLGGFLELTHDIIGLLYTAGKRHDGRHDRSYYSKNHPERIGRNSSVKRSLGYGGHPDIVGQTIVRCLCRNH